MGIHKCFLFLVVYKCVFGLAFTNTFEISINGSYFCCVYRKLIIYLINQLISIKGCYLMMSSSVSLFDYDVGLTTHLEFTS